MKGRTAARAISAAILGVAALLVSDFPAAGATFPVTSTADSGANTLRQAILDSNANGNTEVDQIPLNVTGTITTASEMTISTQVAITGPGASSLTIRSNGSTFRMLGVLTPNAGDATSISDVTIAGARATGFAGGALIKAGVGTTTFNRVVFDDNASSSGGAFHIDGGRILIRDSAFTGNRADFGGAIVVSSNVGAGTQGRVEAANTTFAGNSAREFGGAINTSGSAHMGLANSTLFANTANADNNVIGNGGALYHNSTDPGDITFGITNTILAGNSVGPGSGGTGTQCGGNAYASFGYNLRSAADAGCNGFTGPGDIVEPNPLLGAPTTALGGPTPVVPLLSGSPAIDAGSPLPATGFPGCEPADQRGLPRPAGTRCDIGAFERQPSDDPVAAPPPRAGAGPVPQPNGSPKKCKPKKKKAKKRKCKRKRRKR